MSRRGAREGRCARAAAARRMRGLNMAQPRPSLTLIVDVDERIDSEELRLEIGRSYTYVGSALVRTHAAAVDNAPVENTLRMLVKLGTRQYLNAGEEGSDELWNDVMRTWFENQFRKIGNQTLIYNKRQREIEDGQELMFTWLEVDLQNGQLPVRLRMNDVSSIEESAAEVLSVVREAYNSGKLGEKASIARISTPTAESWKQQVADGAVAAAKRAEEERAAAEAAAAAAEVERAAAEAAAEEAFLESPELVAADEEGEAVVEGGGVEAPELVFELDEPTFAVDYSTWTVEYTDGTSKTFAA